MTSEMTAAQKLLLVLLRRGYSYDEIDELLPNHVIRTDELFRDLLVATQCMSLDELNEKIDRVDAIAKAKNAAVKEADYERAAKLRDQIDEEYSWQEGLSFLDRTFFANNATREAQLESVATAIIAASGQSFSSLDVIVDPGTASSEQIAQLLGELSKLYRMMGGSGLRFTTIDTRSLEHHCA